LKSDEAEVLNIFIDVLYRIVVTVIVSVIPIFDKMKFFKDKKHRQIFVEYQIATKELKKVKLQKL